MKGKPPTRSSMQWKARRKSGSRKLNERKWIEEIINKNVTKFKGSKKISYLPKASPILYVFIFPPPKLLLTAE